MVDRSKFRCYNCEKMGHFASECRESKQADERRSFQRKDSGSKKKYHVKSYIAEGKSWDDTDDEEDEHRNMALMAGDWDLTYGYEVHKMPYDMAKTFNYHTKDCVKYVMDTRREISSLEGKLKYAKIDEQSAKDETEKAKAELSKIQARNDELEITNTQIENLKQRNEYLEKKFLVCVETETELKNKITELDNKLYAFKNSANIAKELFENQVVRSKVVIGLDYNSKKKPVVNSEPVCTSSKDIPQFLNKIDALLFKKAESEPFNQDDLLIAHELLVEDLEELKKEKAKSPSKSVKFVKSKTELGNKSETKNGKNRNGRICKNGPRKLCNNCNSVSHLTHACKNVKTEKNHNAHVHNMYAMPISSKCATTTCIPCTANLMAAYLNVTHASTASK